MLFRIALAVVTLLLCAGCAKPEFDKEIIGAWENAGVPSSTALPENVRASGNWSAEIDFEPTGKLTWRLEDGSGGTDTWRGDYSVTGFSLTIELKERNGTPLPEGNTLRYTLRQQSTGSIRLPLPQDWTGPAVDYFPKR